MTLRKLAILPLISVALFGLALAGCGDDDDDGGDRDAVIAALVDEGATQDEAECFVDELGAGDAERIFTAAEDELSEDDAEKFFDALEACDII